MSRNPYTVLGIEKSATQEEIKRSFHALAKKHHPDHNKGNKESEAKFKEVSEAYNVIGGEEERKLFDKENVPQPSSNSSFNPHNNFSYFFTDFDEVKEVDDYYSLKIDFKEAICGVEKEILFSNGKRVKVKIPPGVESGYKLRFKNQGGTFGRSSDAYVEIFINSQTGFKRVGDNTIESEVAISFIEAILGAEIKVPTIDGSVIVKIPAGISSGSRLRIRGKGAWSLKERKKRGDHYLIIKIVLPKIINPELEKIILKIKDQFSYNPRDGC